MIKLLFVDDEEAVRTSINMVFKTKSNYQTLLAASGGEALQIAAQEKPDLVLLDMRLPDMSGEEVFEKLKTTNPDIKVIFFTGVSQEAVAQKVQALGAAGYLTKPFDALKLEDYFKKTVPDLYQGK